MTKEEEEKLDIESTLLVSLLFAVKKHYDMEQEVIQPDNCAICKTYKEYIAFRGLG